MNLETIPKPLRKQGMPLFQNVMMIDLQNNELTELDSVFC